jgi:SEC-C motif-containing protein
MDCPCGSRLAFDACCGPLLAGGAPPTAEALMRSRYTAYVRADMDHIMRTHDPRTRDTVDRALTEKWAREAEWRGLEILRTEVGGADDEVGTVEFAASYRAKGQAFVHREHSRFRRIDGRWFYVDGRPIKGEPARAVDKPERNAPCPCGSGKKWKRCHGAA